MYWILFILMVLNSCANLTSSGADVSYIESNGDLLEFAAIAEKMVAKHDCLEVGIAHAKTAKFPPVYSLHDNEVHAALRNRAAKMGGNVVIANFMMRPARGIVMKCPDQYLKQVI